MRVATFSKYSVHGMFSTWKNQELFWIPICDWKHLRNHGYISSVILCALSIKFTLWKLKHRYRYISGFHHQLNDTVDRERFAGLNIRGFSAIEVFAEIFSCFLGHKQCASTYYLVQLKRGNYIHGKTFAVLLKTVKSMKV